LAWFERLIAHAAELLASGAPVVLAGDYNVVPTPQDIYPTRSLDQNALIQPESRHPLYRISTNSEYFARIRPRLRADAQVTSEPLTMQSCRQVFLNQGASDGQTGSYVLTPTPTTLSRIRLRGHHELISHKPVSFQRGGQHEAPF
jgi:endonuclease/exonuclease/phosphatase family metal-dependent hydrolase